MGILQYTQDYDEFFLPAFVNNSAVNGSSPPVRGWPELAYPYIKSTQVYQCPSETSTGTNYATREWRDKRLFGTTSTIPLPIHYAYSFYVGGRASSAVGTEFGFKRISMMQDASKVIMMADSGSTPPWNDTPVRTNVPAEEWTKRTALDTTTISGQSLPYPPYILVHPNSDLLDTSTTGYLNYGALYARHLGTTNVLWADGHVKAMKPSAIENTTDIPTEYTTTLNTCFNPYLGCNK